MKLIAGVDEVGRGAFAGPLIACCAVFKSSPLSFWSERSEAKESVRDPISRFTPSRMTIKDSKKMTATQREIADKWIRENAAAIGIGSASVDYINNHGLTKATQFAFRQAVRNAQKKLDQKIHFLFVDAFHISHLKGIGKTRQFAMIEAESKSLAVAAASIVAKVYRDNLMTKLSHQTKYQNYLWDKNKGYGTKGHRNVIKKLGPSKLHRNSFID